ncbi:DUF6503 family protein [Aquimarina sp. 2201CG5-10]|uniref:DUF6503 family protein n=1 Tax=Aquimarina callyspongiae TaxID=3098150 RepID=UPI002AB3947D|nr:DUF6503 family protein [Aquimarina sp. 2201CG5-10]MDY8137880.1 DUF6503 family protein [Aquimarina sp. 2201CG5-10]
MKNLWILILVIALIGCNQNTKEENKTTESTDNKLEKIPVEPDNGIGDGALSIEKHYIKSIEKAHKKEAFLNHKAVSFDVKIFFGGNEHLDGKITMLTNSSKIRIDKKDNSSLIYNGKQVFLQPADANDKRARFDMFTWTYFFGFPYKLSDPGTKWEMQEDRSLDNKTHSTAKLSFDAGIGDAPDDWYVIYTDPKENSLQAAAYIVTYGSEGDTSKAEADPHAIRYRDFVVVDGIPFATKWDFYGWTQEKGMSDTKIGEAMVSNIRFLEDVETLFNTSEDLKVIE